jgi:hypothetical protein
MDFIVYTKRILTKKIDYGESGCSTQEKITPSLDFSYTAGTSLSRLPDMEAI